MTEPRPGAEPEATTDAAPPRPRPRWGLGHAILGYVVAYVLAVMAVGIYAGTAGIEAGEKSLGLVIASMIGLWTGLLGTLFLASRDWRRDFGLEFRWPDLPIGAGIGIASQLVLIPLLYLPFRLADPDLMDRLEEPARELTDLARGPAFILLAVMVSLGAPFVEELFFRGLFQRSLLRRFSPPIAIAGSAVAFGLSHYQLLQLAGLTAFGVVLGIVAHRAGRLGPAISAHVFFNLVTVLALAASR